MHLLVSEDEKGLPGPNSQSSRGPWVRVPPSNPTQSRGLFLWSCKLFLWLDSRTINRNSQDKTWFNLKTISPERQRMWGYFHLVQCLYGCRYSICKSITCTQRSASLKHCPCIDNRYLVLAWMESFLMVCNMI